MSTLPKYTERIFETLSKGGFISSNSSNTEMCDLYNTVSENFEVLEEYFGAIGFRLEAGNEYYHFTRYEIKADIERKLENAYKWIDLLDFFKTYNPAFGPSMKLSPSAIAEQCKVNSELKLKLDGMKKITGDENLPGRIRKLLETLKKDDFVELENEDLDAWKVLTSIHYLERLVELINIQGDDETTQ
jgi:hypothetical protein